MKDNKIALRPYLEAVENICRPLSKEQLVELERSDFYLPYPDLDWRAERQRSRI